MELWNERVLVRPPNNAVQTRILSKDVLKLRDVLKHVLHILESKKFLYQEAAVLSRYLFMNKRRLRHHMGYQFMNKVHRGLKRFLQMDIKDVFINFEKSLSYALDDADVNNFKYIEIYIPTRQLLDYVLIQIQGFAKLMQYLVSACENAASYFRHVISGGQLVKESTLGFCIVSRIWYFSSYYVSCACTWYKELMAFRQVTKPLGADWLPREYNFPKNLSQWLGPNVLTGKYWRSDIDVSVGSAGLPVEKLSSQDLGVVISRDAYEAAASLELTRRNRQTLKTVNSYCQKFDLCPMKGKKRKRQKTEDQDSQEKKLKGNISDDNIDHEGNNKKVKVENDKKLNKKRKKEKKLKGKNDKEVRGENEKDIKIVDDEKKKMKNGMKGKYTLKRIKRQQKLEEKRKIAQEWIQKKDKESESFGLPSVMSFPFLLTAATSEPEKQSIEKETLEQKRTKNTVQEQKKSKEVSSVVVGHRFKKRKVPKVSQQTVSLKT